MSTRETLSFQTEVKELLNLMIHSLYSNKEIFLRELISNASDASDKLRFEALNNSSLYENDGELKIKVSFDKEAKTLTIEDNGIGMSREEVVANIGTIAHSGTKEFISHMTGDQAKDSNLIGQFGVGFYSSFIVADRVTLTTRRAGSSADEGVRWESAGDGEYSLEQVSKTNRGTEIILHLRDGNEEFLNNWQLENIIRKYSDHISIPIVLRKERYITEKNEQDEDVQVLEYEDETVNQASALWTRSKSEITDEQYNEFYKHVGHDYQDPLTRIHSKVEGKQEYTVLFYIPTKAPFDLWDRDRHNGVKLYVKRVFILDDTDKLLPRYLRFIRGIIDSNDLPLNVSREILQESKDIATIRAGCVKKILTMIEDLAKNDAEKFTAFWAEYGKVFKEGIGEDNSNRARIAKLCRFASTHADTDEQNVSLDDYISRMKEGQNEIYYVTAENFVSAKNSPHLEVFRKKGVEVLLLSERVDEWVVAHLNEYEGKQLHSVAKGELNLGDLENEEEKAEQQKQEETLKELVEKIQGTLESKVKQVRITHRLTSSPACLVTDEGEMGMNLDRLLKTLGQSTNTVKPILEINPNHQMISKLNSNINDGSFDDWANVLFDQALLSEGGQLEDPAGFVRRLNQLMFGA